MGLALPEPLVLEGPAPGSSLSGFYSKRSIALQRRRRARERRFAASAMVAGGVPSADESDFPAPASRNLSLRMPLLLNFSEFEKCSRCSVGYRPTIEAVCIPIDKIVALITESLLL